MRKKLLFKPFSIVWNDQTVAQIIIDKGMTSNKETRTDIQEENYLVFKIPNWKPISLLDAYGMILSAISLPNLCSDQSYDQLQDAEPTNQLFTQTILPLYWNINTSTVEVLFSKKLKFLLVRGKEDYQMVELIKSTTNY